MVFVLCIHHNSASALLEQLHVLSLLIVYAESVHYCGQADAPL